MPEVLPRSAEMSVRSLVQAFGKVTHPKNERRMRAGGVQSGGKPSRKLTWRLAMPEVLPRSTEMSVRSLV
jgi:hypothetical protein